MGSVKLPAAVPDKHRALAIERLLSKYLAVKIIPGVVARPIPAPVKTPRVTNIVCKFGMKALRVIPADAKRDPKSVTYRQFNFWHSALASGAMARAVVVIAAGIQEAKLILSGYILIISANNTP